MAEPTFAMIVPLAGGPGAVDPGYGRPIYHPGHPDHGLPSSPGHPSAGLPGSPGHPSAGLPPVPGHPGHGLPWAPARPGHDLPYPPAYPGHGLPSGGEIDNALPVPPADTSPPGSIWPPLTPEADGKFYVVVWIPGYGYRWTIVDLASAGKPPVDGTKPPETATPRRAG